MKYKSSLTFLLLSACVISITLSTNRLLWAGDKNLEKRVSNLEMQVSDLNSRVIQLEKQLSAKSNGAQVVNQNIPAGKAAWRKLQKGMNKDQVRAILGEPGDIMMFSSFEVWNYKNYSSVKFDASGYVDGWDEP